MSSSSIVLYDLDRKGGSACWSPNTWKTRFVLNFKNLDYKTQWLEFPDIKPTLEEQGFPTPAEGAMYTVPAILLQPASSSSTKPVPIMDSLAIAKALEEIHPKPSLYLDAPELTEASNLIDRLRMLIAPVALPMITREVLNPKSVECKEKGFFPKFGMTLDEFEKTKGGDPMWERMRPGLEELAGLMKKQDGPFVLGHTVSYADFIIASFLQTGKRSGNGVMYDRIAAVDDSFEKLFAATQKWAERDDH